VEMDEKVPTSLEEALLRIAELEKEVEKKKEQNKKKNERRKEYYKKHREEQIQKIREYQEKTNYFQNISPEKKKEYARTAYLNKKEKERKKKEAEEEKEKKEKEEDI
jgi:hypothetical protein